VKQRLDEMIEEVKSRPTPETDWSRIETRLAEESLPVQRQVSSSAASKGSGRFAFGAVAALGAAAVAWIWLAPAPEQHLEAKKPISALTEPQPTPGLIDGDRATLGTSISSTNDSVRVAHAGRADWSLAASSEGKIVRRGEVIELELVRGSLHAEVVPRGSESFVVWAGDTRVAVRGTVFDVKFDGERVEVSVTKGTIAVSSRGAPHEAVLLQAPARGSFGKDGHILGERGSKLGLRTRIHAPKPKPAESGVKPLLRAEPTLAEIETGFDTMRDLVAGCAQETGFSSERVKLRIESTLSLQIAPDGSIASYAFSPPLAPELIRCFEAGALPAPVPASGTDAGPVPSGATRSDSSATPSASPGNATPPGTAASGVRFGTSERGVVVVRTITAEP
jgi:hypothetical protein